MKSGVAIAWLVALAAFACGGESSSDVDAHPEADAGKSAGVGGSAAGRTHSAGKGGAMTGGIGSAGESPTGSGGPGSKPASAGGSAGKAASASGSAGEADAGEPSSDGGQTGELGMGGADEAGSGGSGSGAAGSGVAGSGPVSCADLSDETCGGEAVGHLVHHAPKPDTYCIKVNFLGAGRVWYDLRPDECSMGEPDRVMHEQGCFVVWGPAYGSSEQFWVDALYTQQDSGDACVNRISKQTHDANPGNQFCSCP